MIGNGQSLSPGFICKDKLYGFAKCREVTDLPSTILFNKWIVFIATIFIMVKTFSNEK